ncbi:MAG: tRNA (adenosine(37)-N6)-dimethylallyltransferase MiaA [Candidatus Promineifilaceae bacterium]
MNQPLIVLLGQTAVGKTSLSLQLAQALNGEIISADSRLFYRGMDIGTAKPTLTEQAIAPHHLIDLCQPDETITLGDYQRRAYQMIDFVLANGRLPILVGGTGQYVRAVVEGWGIPEVPPHPKLRAALAQLPGTELARWLAALDPAAAEKHDPRNLRRVIRALEVTLVAGRPISDLQQKTPPPYRICQIGLTRPREALYARIDMRVDQMMANGLLEELQQLRQKGYGRSLPSMSGLGYRQLWAYLHGEMSLAEAVERIKFETHRFARHQANWFREDDPAITWFTMEDGVETAVLNHVQNWLHEGPKANGKVHKQP